MYVDRMSQPSRAILIFCRLNGIDFEEVQIDLSKRHHLSPQFTGTIQFMHILQFFLLFTHRFYFPFRSKPSPESTCYSSWKLQSLREVAHFCFQKLFFGFNSSMLLINHFCFLFWQPCNPCLSCFCFSWNC